jgi:hypothetical protein
MEHYYFYENQWEWKAINKMDKQRKNDVIRSLDPLDLLQQRPLFSFHPLNHSFESAAMNIKALNRINSGRQYDKQKQQTSQWQPMESAQCCSPLDYFSARAIIHVIYCQS